MWRTALPGDKLHKIANLLENPEPEAIYRRLVSQWEKPEEVAAAGSEPRGPLWDQTIARDFPAFVPRMQYLDMVSYLPDDILTKIDRATMAVGLEGRVPLLDHRVVAYAWTLPFRFKVRGGSGKWLLRRVLDRYVPRPLIDRPKMGFGVPIDAWLRGPLREWAEQLLAPARLTSYGFVRVEPVRRAWQEHLEGSRNWQYPLVDRADAAGLAREMGVIARPRKILYVTTDLFIGGGAEGMLTRMATAQPRLADEIVIVSLSPWFCIVRPAVTRGGCHGGRTRLRHGLRCNLWSAPPRPAYRRSRARNRAGLDVSR